ncbi:hypothetical protein BKA56DRAFT_302680 [Ilyonectria sp. MPI-CAGE-AT-0026]|nr:hypothetical protein BKA56DRAFT_302680 [Ilyonectria sp. MPI-CAGE-AT-0026]
MLDRTKAWWPLLILLACSLAGALSACISSREKWYVLDGDQRHAVACAILKVPVCWTLTLLVAVGFLGASRQLRIRWGDQGRDWRFVDVEFHDCFFEYKANTRTYPPGEPMLASGSGARCTSTFNSLLGHLQVGRRSLGIQGRLIDRTKGGTTEIRYSIDLQCG